MWWSLKGQEAEVLAGCGSLRSRFALHLTSRTLKSGTDIFTQMNYIYGCAKRVIAYFGGNYEGSHRLFKY